MTAYQSGAAPISAPPAAVDQNGLVITDAPCRKCGYNLRTLSINGRCPECGTAVGYSVHGDLLRFSDPNWVMTLHRGVVLILTAIAVMILGFILMAVVGAAVSEAIGAVGFAVIGIGGYVLLLVGTWMLTEPDPSGLGEDQYGTARQIIRITLLIGVVGQVVDMVVQNVTLPPGLFLALGMISLAAGIVGVVGLFAQLQYIGKLALRIPDESISARANFLKWGLGISYGFMVLLGGVMFLAIRGTMAGGAAPGGAFIGLGCVMGLIGLFVLVLAILYLLMLDRLRRALKQQRDYAVQTWAAESVRATSAGA